MSDELADSSFPVEIGDKTYRCGHISATDRAALRAHIRAERIKAVQATCKKYNAEVLSKTIAQTAAAPVNDLELYGFMSTEEGMLFLLWRGIHRNHVEVTLDHLRNIVEPGLLSLIAGQQYQVSGYMAADGDVGDPNAIYAAPDYDKEVAVVVRYYGLSLAEAESLDQRRLLQLVTRIPETQKILGEKAQ